MTFGQVFAFDIETVPDVEFGRRLHGLDGLSDKQVGYVMQTRQRELTGSEFLSLEQQRVVADPATNSLIIYGTAQEFQNIKTILKDLDAVARQVLMDVLIAEVTLTDDFRFGVDYQIQNKNGDVRIFGREFQSRAGILTGVLPAPAASGLTQFPLGLSGVIGTGDAIRAFINAFAADSRFKVLSSPSVLATDNRPARIQVGSEEPVPTGTITQTVGTIAESTSTSTICRSRRAK